MKLTKSKQALADAIHASGKGWPDGAKFSAQDGRLKAICFYANRKPQRPKRGETEWRSPTGTGFMFGTSVIAQLVIPNWHQTILSRDEYFSAYPAEPVADADGWIEWGGGECPVSCDDIVDVAFAYSTDGAKSISAVAKRLRWSKRGLGGDIIAYRLHNPEVKPEFCESVTRSIPEPSTKPTIEQLAADYRNKLDFANRKKLEAEDAKAVAYAALGELVLAGKAIDLVIEIATPEPELVITDW